MSQLIPFEQAAVPAHIQAAFGGEGNIPDKVTIPQLSFRGKVWRIVINGEETALMRKDPESGDSVPTQTVPLVILDFTKDRSRAYYEGAYVEGQSKAPSCRSQDGKVPDSDLSAPQNPTCAGCPQSVKGSKIVDGKEMVACSTFKNLAVVPASQIDKFPPLRLRLAQTSIWDKDNKENEAQGWFAFDQFIDFIRGRGVTHTGQVLVKAKFDHRVSHPKLLFKADAWLTEEQLKLVLAKKDTPEVKKALHIDEVVKPDDTDDTPATAAAATPAPAAPAKPVKAPKAPAKAAEKAKAAPPAEEPDPFANISPDAKQPPAKAAEPVKEEPVEVIPAGDDSAKARAANLASVLGEWGDD